MAPTKTSERLQLAEDFIATGGKAKARTIVYKILESEPKNADAWYLASWLTDKPTEQLNALNRALSINPRHSKARNRLIELNPDRGSTQLLKVKPTKNSNSVAIATGIILVACLLGAALMGGSGAASQPTFGPTKSSTPAKTYTPAVTRTPTITLTPQFTYTPSDTFTPTQTLSLTERAQLKSANATATRKAYNENRTATAESIYATRTQMADDHAATAAIYVITLTYIAENRPLPTRPPVQQQVVPTQAPQAPPQSNSVNDNPTGATAKCVDGSLSYAAHHQGACSHHQGVAVWYK